MDKKKIIVILHNVRSAYNAGAIMRTLDAVGISKVYMTGYTPVPLDRFGRKRKDIAKSALGAEDSLDWEYRKSPASLIKKLKSQGYEITGVEQDDRAIDYKKFKPKKKAVLIFGNEVRGLSKSLCGACDMLIEIPMHGKKESLNVSVAAGIVLYRLFDL